MNLYFVDTSALAKRYLSETGSTWVAAWIDPSAGNVVVVSRLATVELFSLLSRHRRQGTLSPDNVAAIQENYLLHLDDEYIPVSIDDDLLIDARLLADKYTLRSLDAIQLASAVEAASLLSDPLTFVSADDKLLLAASQEGFTVDNPLNHP